MIELPWPPKELRNAADRYNHFAVSRAVKKARKWAREATMGVHGVKPKSLPFIGDRLPICITFYPPTRHARDEDNLRASCKAYQDGIADALGVNDRCFACHYQFEEPVKGGKIVVEIGR